MSTPLSRLIAAIEPVPDRVDRVIDEAFARFRPPPGRLDDPSMLAPTLDQLFTHLEGAYLGLKHSPAINSTSCLDCCWKLLRQDLGENPAMTAYDIVRTGNEGGLAQLMRLLSRRLAIKLAGDQIHTAVSMFVDSRRRDGAIFDDVREYLTTYGHLLPSELTDGAAARVHANFGKVLEIHPYTVKGGRDGARRLG